MPDLRVIDFGTVSPLRSQTLWHAIAYGVSAGAPPALSFMRPSRPYVGIGFHTRLQDVDTDACAEAGLPIYRRMVGGGVVYLDSAQQFFQICLPKKAVPPAREAALRLLLAPAVEAFRAVGIPADLDGEGEIALGEAKVCGHGAAEIEEAVVVVGNLIEAFDHEAAAGVLRVDPEVREDIVRLMRRHVAATPADAAAFKEAATRAYGAALELEPVIGRLNDYERRCLGELDERFRSPGWLRGPDRLPAARSKVKIRAGVWA
jgi:lipoate-protein ligase A